MQVNEIMSHTVVSVDADDSLGKVKSIFDQVSFHHVVVTENDRLFGMISDRDLLKAISPTAGTIAETRQDYEYLKKRACIITSRKPVYLKPTDDVLMAVELFNRNNISCIPIVNDEMQPVGILSWRDVLKNYKYLSQY